MLCYRLHRVPAKQRAFLHPVINEPWLGDKKILMLEPRRLAARSCGHATWQVGSAKKLETQSGIMSVLTAKFTRSTRIEIITEGILIQRLLADPELKDVGLIIFDEFS